ncbi:MAG: hypothetical protein ACKV2Q_08150 [Planctomycetaceae bacterium]
MSANELLTEVLKLPRPQRQAFAEQVCQSLEWDPDDVSPEFVEELKRAVEEVQSGDYESMSLAESKALAWKALAEVKR